MSLKANDSGAKFVVGGQSLKMGSIFFAPAFLVKLIPGKNKSDNARGLLTM